MAIPNPYSSFKISDDKDLDGLRIKQQEVYQPVRISQTISNTTTVATGNAANVQILPFIEYSLTPGTSSSFIVTNSRIRAPNPTNGVAGSEIQLKFVYAGNTPSTTPTGTPYAWLTWPIASGAYVAGQVRVNVVNMNTTDNLNGPLTFSLLILN